MRKTQWIAGLAAGLLAAAVHAQVEVDIKNGDGVVAGMTLGTGDHAVIAVHGANANRSYFFSERGGDLGAKLAKAGFKVIAFSWAGTAGAGFPELTAAIKYARDNGAKKVSLVGFSRGGELVANYARKQADGEFDSVVQLSSVDDQGLTAAKTKKLFAFNKYDRFANWQPAAFDKSAEPKQQIALGGGGHQVKDLLGEKADLDQDVIALLKK